MRGGEHILAQSSITVVDDLDTRRDRKPAKYKKHTSTKQLWQIYFLDNIWMKSNQLRSPAFQIILISKESTTAGSHQMSHCPIPKASVRNAACLISSPVSCQQCICSLRITRLRARFCKTFGQLVQLWFETLLYITSFLIMN